MEGCRRVAVPRPLLRSTGWSALPGRWSLADRGWLVGAWVVRMLLVPLALTCGAIPEAVGAPPSPAVRAEIESLLQRLASSGCEFNRNGTWYPGPEARAHLLVKLKYVEDHGTIGSAEQFIDVAASASSISGKPYLVRCAGAAAVPSGPWLKAQLPAIRATPASPVIRATPSSPAAPPAPPAAPLPDTTRPAGARADPAKP